MVKKTTQKRRMYQKGRNQNKRPFPKLVRNEVEDFDDSTSVDKFIRIVFAIILFFIGVFGFMEIFLL